MYEERIKLIKKGLKRKPTKEELQKAYGYLDNCLDCGKRFRFLEPSSHSIMGNSHLIGCSILSRIFGVIFGILRLVLRLILLPVLLPIGLILCLVEWIKER